MKVDLRSKLNKITQQRAEGSAAGLYPATKVENLAMLDLHFGAEKRAEGSASPLPLLGSNQGPHD